MKSIPLHSFLIVFSCASAVWMSSARAECSIINRLRVASAQHFRSMAGEPVSKYRTGYFKSTLDIKGPAKCTIEMDDDESWATHKCTWIISKDQGIAKTTFDAMVAETAPCLRSHEPPSHQTEYRSESVSFEDVPNTSVGLSYEFDSGWYLIELSYAVNAK